MKKVIPVLCFVGITWALGQVIWLCMSSVPPAPAGTSDQAVAAAGRELPAPAPAEPDGDDKLLEEPKALPVDAPQFAPGFPVRAPVPRPPFQGFPLDIPRVIDFAVDENAHDGLTRREQRD